MSTAEYRVTAPPLLRLGTGADAGPGAFLLLAVRPSALPHVGLFHVDQDCVVHNPVHDGVRVDPATEPRAPVLLFELGTEDGGGGAAPQFHRHTRASWTPCCKDRDRRSENRDRLAGRRRSKQLIFKLPFDE